MCGIVATFGQPDETFLRSALTAMRHRGPDDEGMFVGTGAALGHRRLSIIDVAGGHQPIFNESGNVGIVLNGEIYNFRELRKDLETRHTFRTHSDTEVILHLYEDRGIECVHELAGMFAFAVYDQGRLVVARDRIGIKPLYSATNAGTRVFASELKALSGCEEIQEFPPGHIWSSDLGFREFYSLPLPREDGISEDEAIRGVRDLLREAVRRRMVADVPVGVFLSGGLDSSIIAALMKEQSEQLHSFAVGIQGSPDLAAAREVAEHLETIHHEYVYTEQDMVRVLSDVLYYLESFDAPLVRSAVPGFFVSELARREVKVILTGEGADELFGGYHYLRALDDPARLTGELTRITSNLHNTNLQRTDRMTMAHSVEARVPFLDPEVIDFAFRLPTRFRMAGPDRMEKWILRKAFEDLLPPAVAWRRKQKFSEGAGSSDILRQVADRTISDDDMRTSSASTPVTIRSKEEMMFYRIFLERLGDESFPLVVGRTADYPTVQ